MSDYQRISCETHSIYELAIMHGRSIQVVINDNTQTIQPKDILTKAGTEYLTFVDENNTQQELRVDSITLKP